MTQIVTMPRTAGAKNKPKPKGAKDADNEPMQIDDLDQLKRPSTSASEAGGEKQIRMQGPKDVSY